MITGIGVDAVYVKRMEHWCENPHLLERYFHPNELEIIVSRGKNAPLSLAARFAAKEAFGKALGTGLANINLKDLLVINRHNGNPQMQVFGTAREELKKSGADRVHVSLTHEKDYAIAMVVLERI